MTRPRKWIRELALVFAATVFLCALARVNPAQVHAGPAPAATLSAQSAPAATARLSDLSWLEGRWRGEWGPRVAEQVWMAPKGGVMTGVFSVVETDKTLVIELFSLEQKAAGIDFYLRHFTPELAPWEKDKPTVLKLANSDGKQFVFENPADGKPKRTVFTRVDADTYAWRSEIAPENEAVQIVEITYRCMQHATDSAVPGVAAHKKKS